jgi:hypothetical protein
MDCYSDQECDGDGGERAMKRGTMQQVTIDRFRIVPAPLTGIGWVAVQEWDRVMAQYEHYATFRSMSEAATFINRNGLLVKNGE